ncbi:PqqD family peptide modification chaperone [bacterium]|nr:PqqD family peptide modification chaperone [bacterium]
MSNKAIAKELTHVKSYKKSKFLIELFDREALVMRTKDKKILEFDEVGVIILECLLSEKSVELIEQELINHYDIDRKTAKKDVGYFLEHLYQKGFKEGLSQELVLSECIHGNSDRPQRLAFHAASISLDNRIVLLSGDGGIGKSTIAQALEEAGYDIPGDEVAYISLCDDNVWKMTASLKMHEDGKYRYIEHSNPGKLALVVLLRSHQNTGYTLESCKPPQAVKESFQRLFCDRIGDPTYLADAFHWTSSIFRQSKAVFLDFSKTISFMPDIKELLNGDQS